MKPAPSSPRVKGSVQAYVVYDKFPDLLGLALSRHTSSLGVRYISQDVLSVAFSSLALNQLPSQAIAEPQTKQRVEATQMSILAENGNSGLLIGASADGSSLYCPRCSGNQHSHTLPSLRLYCIQGSFQWRASQYILECGVRRWPRLQTKHHRPLDLATASRIMPSRI